MKLFLIAGVYPEDEGTFSPLDCWSEYDVDDNYDGWQEAVRKQQARIGRELNVVGVVSIEVDAAKVYEYLTQPLELSSDVTLEKIDVSE